MIQVHKYGRGGGGVSRGGIRRSSDGPAAATAPREGGRTGVDGAGSQDSQE